MKLIHAQSGEPAKANDLVKHEETGEDHRIVSWTEPTEKSEGLVTVRTLGDEHGDPDTVRPKTARPKEYGLKFIA